MSDFKSDLKALIARHLEGLAEEPLSDARLDIQLALDDESRLQEWLRNLEDKLRWGHTLHQLDRDLLNPKPHGRKAWWLRKQLWQQGTIFLLYYNLNVAQVSPPGFGIDRWIVRMENNLQEVADAILAASHKISLTYAIDHYQDAVKRQEDAVKRYEEQ
jgi:hypothetical protein